MAQKEVFRVSRHGENTVIITILDDDYKPFTDNNGAVMAVKLGNMKSKKWSDEENRQFLAGAKTRGKLDKSLDAYKKENNNQLASIFEGFVEPFEFDGRVLTNSADDFIFLLEELPFFFKQVNETVANLDLYVKKIDAIA
ncbi:MAG: hypothetical protein PHD53_00140 [Methylococcales bacterium]|nr:hypothetical protein [Methylococcales bacterium]